MGVVNNMPPPPFPWERPDTHCIGAGLAPRPVCMGEENLAPTGIRALDPPARSKSQY